MLSAARQQPLLRQITCISKSAFRYFATSNTTADEITLDYSRPDGVVIMGLNRPQAKNAMSKSLMTSFADAMANFRQDSKTRVVILRSMVPGIFCAGADLKERVGMSPEEVGPLVSKARSLFHELASLPMPVLCALDGHALGGGLEMALACDFRIAANNAKVGLVETKLAIIPGAGGTQRLPRLVGICKAKELLFTAAILSGEEAARINLVNECVHQNQTGDAAYEKCLDIARQIASNGPIAVRCVKEAVEIGMQQPTIEEALTIEENCYAKVIPTKDRIEGLIAFKEKRKPNYTGM